MHLDVHIGARGAGAQLVHAGEPRGRRSSARRSGRAPRPTARGPSAGRRPRGTRRPRPRAAGARRPGPAAASIAVEAQAGRRPDAQRARSGWRRGRRRSAPGRRRPRPKPVCCSTRRLGGDQQRRSAGSRATITAIAQPLCASAADASGRGSPPADQGGGGEHQARLHQAGEGLGLAVAEAVLGVGRGGGVADGEEGRPARPAGRARNRPWRPAAPPSREASQRPAPWSHSTPAHAHRIERHPPRQGGGLGGAQGVDMGVLMRGQCSRAVACRRGIAPSQAASRGSGPT